MRLGFANRFCGGSGADPIAGVHEMTMTGAETLLGTPPENNVIN